MQHCEKCTGGGGIKIPKAEEQRPLVVDRVVKNGTHLTRPARRHVVLFAPLPILVVFIVTGDISLKEEKTQSIAAILRRILLTVTSSVFGRESKAGEKSVLCLLQPWGQSKVY